ncbi:MAG: tetratricopeptide repeat protein, partial [Bacteroidia bacterium]
LSQKDFVAAKAAYKTAVQVKPDEDYPKNQLDVIKEMELTANAEALAAQQKLDKEYSDLMTQGEEAMVISDWNLARDNFSKASKLKPESKGPKERLNDIDRLIQKEKDLANAAAELEEDYAERMKNGQTSLDDKRFADAKRFFFGASKLKPNESLPKQKLEETEALWAKQVEQDKALAAQQKAEQLENNYNGFITSGDKAFENEMWDEAIKSYQGAIALKQEEAYPKQKLSEVKKAKSEALAQAENQRKQAEAAALAAERERMRLEAEAQAKADLESRFTTAMAVGDEAMTESQYKSAVRSYKKAVKLKPENAQAQSKLADAQEKFNASEIERKAAQAEKNRLAAIELEKRKEAARIKREAYLEELNKNSPEELAKRYPDGITEEVETENETVRTTLIIPK